MSSILKLLKKFIKLLWGGLVILRKMIGMAWFFLILIFVLSLFSSYLPSIKDNNVLVINPRGQLVDQLQGDAYERAVNEIFGEISNEVLVDDIVDALNYAENDERISVIALRLDEMKGGGLSKLETIGIALDKVRESGKQVIAYSDFYSQESYYLAARADQIYLHPDGIFFPDGYSYYSNYYKDLIDKIKVDWNIFRAGDYKTAVEPFMRNDMSTESKDSRSRIANKLWSKYENDVVTARNLPEKSVTIFARDLLDSINKEQTNIASIAYKNNLFDGLLTKDQIELQISKKMNIAETEFGESVITFDDYLKVMRLNERSENYEDNIAVIVASGEILNGNHAPGVIGGESTSKLLRKALHDDSVRGVLLKIDSPGGSAFASEQILKQIIALQAASKPVVVLMGSVAASGGYWIAMSADKIYASPATITGSIGVFAMFPTLQNSLAELGIYTDGSGTNQWSGSFRLDKEMSPSVKQLVQSQVDYGYSEFVRKVSTHRDIPEEKIREIAKGQIWTGIEALDNGLIDALGGFNEALNEIEILTNLSDSQYGLIYLQQDISTSELFAVSFLDTLSALNVSIPKSNSNLPIFDYLNSEIEKFMLPLLRFNDPKNMYAYCFCELN
ncbi:MAG: protease-4 [Woeseiaceae bacterium]|jgi:protease-4|tara:strand:- start:10485 stop:12338 length:1854 start_codon:yes stop_codon:yes gene_type:complete